MTVTMHISSECIEDQIDDLMLKLQSERIRKKISQQEIAKITGIAATRICNLEHYAVKPLFEEIVKISAALDITMTVSW